MLAIALLATLAVLATAVIFGTDVFSGLVLRPALAELDDGGLVQVAGRIHRYGDRRLPVAGVASVVAALAAAVVGLVSGHVVAGLLAAVGLVALLAWLALYARISAPINRALTAAALAGETLADARRLQARWESVIVVRAVLQGAALVLFCAAIASGAAG